MDTNNRDVNWINKEEKKLRDELKEAKNQRDHTSVLKIKTALVKLYVQHGEYFKMSDQPDPRVAEHCLTKAVNLQKDHPIANYRLAHILYKRKRFVEALTHFERALEGSSTEGLNESQEIISNIFMANCGMFIAKQALKEIQLMKENPYLTFDENLIGRYSPELKAAIDDMNETKYYRKITSDKEEIISEENVQLMLTDRDSKTIMLTMMDEGLHINYNRYEAHVERTAFQILYFVIRAEHLLTGENISERLYKGTQEEYSDEVIRQTFSRLQRRLPFWNDIIQTEQVLNHETNRRRTARKRKEDMPYCIICRVEDVLPDEW